MARIRLPVEILYSEYVSLGVEIFRHTITVLLRVFGWDALELGIIPMAVTLGSGEFFPGRKHGSMSFASTLTEHRSVSLVHKIDAAVVHVQHLVLQLNIV